MNSYDRYLRIYKTNTLLRRSIYFPAYECLTLEFICHRNISLFFCNSWKMFHIMLLEKLTDNRFHAGQRCSKVLEIKCGIPDFTLIFQADLQLNIRLLRFWKIWRATTGTVGLFSSQCMTNIREGKRRATIVQYANMRKKPDSYSFAISMKLDTSFVVFKTTETKHDTRISKFKIEDRSFKSDAAYTLPQITSCNW